MRGPPVTPIVKQTLLGIARCPIFMNGGVNTPCATIVGVQQDTPPTERQVPEPWRGSYAAPLLFVSSNPSIDPNDNSPAVREPDHELVDYFDAGFPEIFPRIVLGNGHPSDRVVSFWSSIRKRAAELWDLHPEKIKPGLDFAITELVHCKSKRETGVKQALKTCVKMHWNSTVAASQARIIVVLGSFARVALNLSIPSITYCTVGTKKVTIMTLPHPNARVPRNVLDLYTQDQIAPIREALKNRLTPCQTIGTERIDRG